MLCERHVEKNSNIERVLTTTPHPPKYIRVISALEISLVISRDLHGDRVVGEGRLGSE